MKNIFLVLSLLCLSACSYSQNMVNQDGHTIRCWSSGWGIIGGPMAISALNDCIASHKQLGYIEIEKIGVPGFFMNEGNPPTIQSVQAGLPADRAGMQSGDKIISVNGQKVSSMIEATRAGFCNPGSIVNYQVERNGEIKSFAVITTPKAKKPE